jgi:uncharacterized lipoprotein NlpE involved in copper resistance
MMKNKRFALVAVLITLLFGFGEQNVSLAQSSKKVKNFRIKSTTEWVTFFNGDEKSEPKKDTYTAFDKEGNTIEKIEYNKDGSIKKRETAVYDSKGNLIEETKFESKSDKESKDNSTKKVTYKYNASNDKIEEVFMDADGIITKKIVYTYNRNGDKTVELTMDASSKVLKKSIYTYDAKGLKFERKNYNGENVLESIKKYEYTY